MGSYVVHVQNIRVACDMQMCLKDGLALFQDSNAREYHH